MSFSGLISELEELKDLADAHVVCVLKLRQKYADEKELEKIKKRSKNLLFYNFQELKSKDRKKCKKYDRMQIEDYLEFLGLKDVIVTSHLRFRHQDYGIPVMRVVFVNCTMKRAVLQAHGAKIAQRAVGRIRVSPDYTRLEEQVHPPLLLNTAYYARIK